MHRPSIISLGEVLWDLFPEGARFGGAPANFACHAAVLGGDVAMVSAVGDDPRGQEAIRILKGFGSDVGAIQIIPSVPTGSVGVALDARGKPSFTIHEDSAWDQIAWDQALEARVRKADAVYFGSLGQRGPLSRSTIRRALALAAEADCPRILDINLRAPFYDHELIRDSVALASILKFSDDELDEVCTAWDISSNDPPAECLARLRERADLDLVVMTCGAEGALLVSADQTTAQPGVATSVRDTVGAGDAFTAAFLVGLLRGDAHEVALASANKRAAEVCSQPGAVPHRQVHTTDQP